jgi:hypothetical protein
MGILKYENVELDIVSISNEDIITSSNDLPNDDWNANANANNN